ncbi:MAG: aminomethyl-transferring glycine dehydrogenase [Bacteroidales bacterium]|jgi:glycine dehydrogenase|nr:aminomethyl-transferring glycine dehydrogenase [Bacteroidales bacterium]
MITDNFAARHNGPQKEDIKKMLKTIGVSSIDELIEKTIPSKIRLTSALPLPKGMNEYEFITHIKGLAQKNKIYKSFIGMGYYNTITPAVLQRNILENPSWYTSYTPYQAEISQGRLEALFNFQTAISSLTAMPIANASMLDEATACAEMMLMFFYSRSREQQKNNIIKFFVSDDIFPQNIEVIKTRALPKNIELVIGDSQNIELDETFFGAILQYPNCRGEVRDYSSFVSKAKEHNIMVGVCCDLLSLALLTPPGEWGVDCVCGTSQRFGLPMGFGGPSAGFFACKEDFKRNMPGRIIGLTQDAQGNKCFRLALQTREQHIKREKATSNICTASALVAIMAGSYALWHGEEGIKDIANDIHCLAGLLSKEGSKYKFEQLNKVFFDTLYFKTPIAASVVCKIAEQAKINFNYVDNTHISIALDETTSIKDVNNILSVFALSSNIPFKEVVCDGNCSNGIISGTLKRKTGFLKENIFNLYHSETQMMRYLKKLEIKDLSLNRAMIPLGSCTMKLNAAVEMIPFTWMEFCNIHPLVPKQQAKGYLEMIDNLSQWLCKVTGFDAISLQPNSGAAGEYAGLMTIRNYQMAHSKGKRNVCLIPSSAHGTNPASASMAGMDIIVVKSTQNGEIDIDDLREKAEANKNKLSCLMITYPSTHGVFEEGILEIIDIIHNNGGLVYMDGANMNAQVGLTSPGFMGADVCHLNLHKTFAMPHGGGGPGVGPIGVSAKLANYLPNHCLVKTGGKHGNEVSASPYGSPMLLCISYAYLLLLGSDGLEEATRIAILNANYIKARLSKHYNILYTGKNGMVAHEMILDCNQFSLTSGVQCGDVAKRLMDYGFHAPTVAFPVHGTLMIEPTESEPLSEMDRLCDALIKIREEIKDIEKGKADKANNVITNAPHTMQVVCADTWDRPYTREKAAFPQENDDKYWPSCSRVDDAFGDRNLCSRWEK